MKAFCIALFLFVSISVATAQSAYHLSLFPGYLVPHREYMANMAAHTIGGEIAIQFDGTGNTYRDSLLRNLEWGVALYFNYLGRPQLNGNVIAITPYFQSPLRTHKRSKSYLRIGTGLGFFTNTFDPISNPKNRAISNRLNGTMQFIFLNYRPLNDKYSFFYGIGLTHFSNGNYSRPNLGINTPQLNLGVKLNSGKEKNKSYDTTRLYPKSYLETRIAYGVKEAGVADPTIFSIYTLALTQGIGITPIRNIRVGFDLFYDKLNPYTLFVPSSAKGYKLKEAMEVGTRLGFEYDFGKVTVFFDMGYYLYKPEGVGKLNYYSCIGINYHFRDFNAGTRLKTHAANADYVDFGIAYRAKAKYMDKLIGRGKK